MDITKPEEHRPQGQHYDRIIERAAQGRQR
ncbi:hypothetical protein ABH924_000509 [Arthrobacter sp. GAS37]|jgi:hypothetical protein|nr:hypothetical protein [Arthrobacter bambusae]MDQ0235412.1 hypothetical protein [Arthrobacter bambusae]